MSNNEMSIMNEEKDASSELRQWEEVEIDVPWGHVCGKWYGNRSEQPILAFHGWMDNAGTFDRLIPLLPSTIPVFAIDLPGHGRSSHYPIGMNYHIFWDYIPLLRRIVKHFGWQQIKLIGHSMGASLCFMYAASYPKDVEQIVMLESYGPLIRVARKDASITGFFIDKMLSLEISKQPQYTYDQIIKFRMDESSIDRDSAAILMKRSLEPMTGFNGEQKYTIRTDARLKYSTLGLFTLEQILSYAVLIQCPILNIRAIPGLKFDRPDVYKQVINTLQNNVDVDYHEIPGSHHLHLEAPEKIANIISQFLLNVYQI